MQMMTFKQQQIQVLSHKQSQVILFSESIPTGTKQNTVLLPVRNIKTNRPSNYLPWLGYNRITAIFFFLDFNSSSKDKISKSLAVSKRTCCLPIYTTSWYQFLALPLNLDYIYIYSCTTENPIAHIQKQTK